MENLQDLSAEQFGFYGNEWKAGGARIVGGCCGIGPAHIAELSRIFYGETKA